MFSKVFSSYDFRIKLFFLVSECFPEALCVFLFSFVRLCSRGSLSRVSVGGLLPCVSCATPLFGLSQTEKTIGECTNHQAQFLVPKRLSFSATLLLCMGTFLLLPTVRQPAGAHISSGSKRKLRTETIVTVLQARAETRGILWSGIGFVKRSPDGGGWGGGAGQSWRTSVTLAASKSSGYAVDSFSTVIFFLVFLKMMYTCATHFLVCLQGFVQFLVC